MWGRSLPKGWEERAKGTPKYRTPRLGNRVVQYVHSCLGVRSPKRSYVQLARLVFSTHHKQNERCMKFEIDLVSWKEIKI